MTDYGSKSWQDQLDRIELCAVLNRGHKPVKKEDKSVSSK